VYPPIAVVQIDSYSKVNNIHGAHFWVCMMATVGAFIDCKIRSDFRMGGSTLHPSQNSPIRVHPSIILQPKKETLPYIESSKRVKSLHTRQRAEHLLHDIGGLGREGNVGRTKPIGGPASTRKWHPTPRYSSSGVTRQT
jgi:hypothetical protein